MNGFTRAVVLLLSCTLIACTSACAGEPGSVLQFPRIPGMEKVDGLRTYTPETLYEYIDGAAEVYIAYEFRELRVQFYEGEETRSITIEAYRHSSPRTAFGIYSAERPARGDFLDIATQGYYEKGILNFTGGSYYVKLSAFNLGDAERDTLVSLAEKMAAQINEGSDLPELLDKLPEEGRVENSERFIVRDFLGYSFLGNALLCDYDTSGKKFQIFVIEESDSATCKKILDRYLRTLGHPGWKTARMHNAIEDPHHGEIDLVWKGRHIWGILGLEDRKLRVEYTKKLERIVRATSS